MKREDDSDEEDSCSHLKVVVRARPLSDNEGKEPLFTVSENKLVHLSDPAIQYPQPEEAFRINRTKERVFEFDVALGDVTSQMDVFQQTAEPLLEGVTKGKNATVFAYGATGAGKTYTMLGTPEAPGIMISTISELFLRVHNLNDPNGEVRISYLEIYNEMVRDLIKPSDEIIELWEDPQQGVVVAGLTAIKVDSWEEIMDKISNANRNRTVEPTKANAHSSRSHAVLQIIIERQSSQTEITHGKLSLIDLAGSERASNTQNKGIRLIEGAKINRSLLALANCINALFHNDKRKVGKIHIPFRDSKLTRLLKDSLGGSWMTVMIACIAPTFKAYEDTLNTLIYANRAKNIKIRAKVNVKQILNPPEEKQGKRSASMQRMKKQMSGLSTNSSVQLSQSRGLYSTKRINKCKIELDNHFKEEFDLRMRILEIERNLQDSGAKIFEKNNDLWELRTNVPNSSKEIKQLSNDIATLHKWIKQYQGQLSPLVEQVQALEAYRDQHKELWSLQKLSEQETEYLSLVLQQNSLQMGSLNHKRIENNTKYIMTQKENYIKKLENQLQIRDKMIESAEEILKKKKYGKMLDAKNRQKWVDINQNRPLEFSSLNEVKSDPVLKRPKIISKLPSIAETPARRPSDNPPSKQQSLSFLFAQSPTRIPQIQNPTNKRSQVEARKLSDPISIDETSSASSKSIKRRRNLKFATQNSQTLPKRNLSQSQFIRSQTKPDLSKHDLNKTSDAPLPLRKVRKRIDAVQVKWGNDIRNQCKY